MAEGKLFDMEDGQEIEPGGADAQGRLLVQEVRALRKATERAANISLEVKEEMTHLRQDVLEAFRKQTVEVAQVVQISVDSALSHQRKQHESGLTMKVALPVGTIAALATIVQWILTHFH